MEFLIGVSGGVATAAFLWLITRGLSPRIKWGSGVSVCDSTSASRLAYYVKIKNSSFFRPILDLRIRGEVVVKRSAPHGWLRLPVSVSHEDMLHLSPRNPRTLLIDLALITPMTKQLVSDEIPDDFDTFARPERRMRKMLVRAGRDSYLVVGVLAKDGLSGREKYLRSPFYRKDNIQPYDFARRKSRPEDELHRWRTRLKRLYDRQRPEMSFDTSHKTTETLADDL